MIFNILLNFLFLSYYVITSYIFQIKKKKKKKKNTRIRLAKNKFHNKSNKMKLDIHTHILPSSLPNLDEKFGYPGWISVQRCEHNPDQIDMYKNGQFFRRVEKNCFCLNERCRDMAKTNVTAQVLSTVPVMFNYWAKPSDCLTLSRMLNDDIAHNILNFQSDERTFYGFGTIPMQDPGMN